MPKNSMGEFLAANPDFLDRELYLEIRSEFLSAKADLRDASPAEICAVFCDAIIVPDFYPYTLRLVPVSAGSYPDLYPWDAIGALAVCIASFAGATGGLRFPPSEIQEEKRRLTEGKGDRSENPARRNPAPDKIAPSRLFKGGTEFFSFRKNAPGTIPRPEFPVGTPMS